MDERLTRLLEQTRDAHRIMEYDERETADDRLRRKPALRSRLVDDCESLENWKALTRRWSFRTSMPTRDGTAFASARQRTCRTGFPDGGAGVFTRSRAPCACCRTRI